MLFAKDFFYSFIAFWIVLAATSGVVASPFLIVIWMDYGPYAVFPLLGLSMASCFALAFAIHEHRKRGGR